MNRKYHLSNENQIKIDSFIKHFRAKGGKDITARNKKTQLSMFFGELNKDWNEVTPEDMESFFVC